jgi:hypothetical protein
MTRCRITICFSRRESKTYLQRAPATAAVATAFSRFLKFRERDAKSATDICAARATVETSGPVSGEA